MVACLEVRCACLAFKDKSRLGRIYGCVPRSQVRMPRVQGQESARANLIDGVGVRLDLRLVRRWVLVAAAGTGQADDRKKGATWWLVAPPQSYYPE
jgi:hypothetical protein